MSTLTELDQYFKTLNRMNDAKDPKEKERLKIKLDEYLKSQ